MNEAAMTLDGWYCLHDFRSIDWASWKLVSAEERQQATEEFLKYLENLNEAHVATVGGDSFGNNDCIRLSYAAADDQLIEALNRIKTALGRLTK